MSCRVLAHERRKKGFLRSDANLSGSQQYFTHVSLLEELKQRSWDFQLNAKADTG
jgi:hypothetical protein